MAEPLRSSGSPTGYNCEEQPLSADRRRLSVVTREKPKLDHAAQRVDTIGTAVDAMKNLPQRAQTVKDQLTERAQALGQEARETAEHWKDTAKERLTLARERSAEFAYERPFHVIAAAGIVGFAVGLGVRLRRSSRG